MTEHPTHKPDDPHAVRSSTTATGGDQVVVNNAPINTQVNIGQLHATLRLELGVSAVLLVAAVVAFAWGWLLLAGALFLLSLVLLIRTVWRLWRLSSSASVGAASTGFEAKKLVGSAQLVAMALAGAMAIDPDTFATVPVLGALETAVARERFRTMAEAGEVYFSGTETGSTPSERSTQVWVTVEGGQLRGRYNLGTYEGTFDSIELTGLRTAEIHWRNTAGQAGGGRYVYDPQTRILRGEWWLDGDPEPRGFSELRWEQPPVP